MAEDNTVESPSVEGGGEISLEDLRQALADKQEELAGLRAQREQAQRAAVDKVQRAQLKQAIAVVERDIEAEKVQLKIQEDLDPQLVGTGVATESELPPAPVDPEEVANPEGQPVLQTLEYGAVAQVTPAPIEEQPAPDDNTSEGGEN